MFYINYLESFYMGDMSLLPSIFDHLFMQVWTHGYLIYTQGYHLVLCYLVCCSNCSIFGKWSLFSLLCSFRKSPLLCVWYVYICVLQEALQLGPGSFQPQNQPFLQDALIYFVGGIIFETKIWAMDVFIAAAMSLLLGRLADDKQTHVHLAMWSPSTPELIQVSALSPRPPH